ncbi:putative pre-rRNA-processing protein IPI1/Testis-expressed sequence 10 protein [Rosa chinensis]|uniref:Putative pre-rRNA-processing protein IPI1/Testis-expressed sequence 10 protein n=1 Tax=Rosa chinensis TaxID=74649 RepID=A0A2P6SBH3_ROSCH|nr:putative pre-rRNA-processing protein IPI1/Testis-expressed sequence 10 protein [Rosa chinensis]
MISNCSSRAECGIREGRISSEQERLDFERASSTNISLQLKNALLGIKDLFFKHPEELRLHKYAVIEKLCERIGDDDRLVRETLYQLFKSVIFPGFKEDNQELFVSLMMAYIFNSMTHLAIDVRLMAFKFLELVIQYYPPSFFLYAEKFPAASEPLQISSFRHCSSLFGPNACRSVPTSLRRHRHLSRPASMRQFLQ